MSAGSHGQWAVDALMDREIQVGLNTMASISLLGWPGPRCLGASSSQEKQQMKHSNIK